MWDETGGELVKVDDILADIKETLATHPELKGVTFLGGEPFSQALALSRLAKQIRSLGLSIVTFSGYTYEVLARSNDEGDQALLGLTDLLIDGPYNLSLHDLSRPWIGSKNQQYRFLTDMYQDEILATNNKLEICIQKDGTLLLNGMATSLDLEDLLQNLDC